MKTYGASAMVDPDPDCGAVVRRNAIDGQLYPCEFPKSDPIHGSVEDCSTSLRFPCRAPDQHHGYEPFPVTDRFPVLDPS